MTSRYKSCCNLGSNRRIRYDKLRFATLIFANPSIHRLNSRIRSRCTQIIVPFCRIRSFGFAKLPHQAKCANYFRVISLFFGRIFSRSQVKSVFKCCFAAFSANFTCSLLHFFGPGGIEGGSAPLTPPDTLIIFLFRTRCTRVGPWPGSFAALAQHS